MLPSVLDASLPRIALGFALGASSQLFVESSRIKRQHHHAAKKIQGIFRRKQFIRSLELKIHQKKYRAASKIQKLARNYLHYKTTCAKKILAAWDTYCQRKKANAAAKRIQKMWRVYFFRLIVRKCQQDACERKAVKVIQNSWHHFLFRRAMWSKVEKFKQLRKVPINLRTPLESEIESSTADIAETLAHSAEKLAEEVNELSQSMSRPRPSSYVYEIQVISALGLKKKKLYVKTILGEQAFQSKEARRCDASLSWSFRTKFEPHETTPGSFLTIEFWEPKYISLFDTIIGYTRIDLGSDDLIGSRPIYAANTLDEKLGDVVIYLTETAVRPKV